MTVVRVLIEFTGVRSELTFKAALPERPEGAFLEVDPLSLVTETGCDVPGLVGGIAREISAIGVDDVYLVALCRGAALLTPLANALRKRDQRVAGVVAVDPVTIPEDGMRIALEELAAGLNVVDPEVSAGTTPAQARALITRWTSDFYASIGFEDDGELSGELAARYLAWIEFHRWAASGAQESLREVPVHVVAAAAQPANHLGRFLGPETAFELIGVPGPGPAVGTAQGAAALRRLIQA